MKLVLIAPMNGGKGSLARGITEKYGIPGISTGDLLRAEIANNTKLGKSAKEYMDGGKLVPDELVIKMLFERIGAVDCKNGFILDGFPRTLAQAKALEDVTKIDAVVHLDVPDWLVKARAEGRETCTADACGKIWSKRYEGYKPGICGDCGAVTKKRGDDKDPASVQKRLDEYHHQSGSVLKYYRDRGVLFTTKVETMDVVPAETFKIVDDGCLRKLGGRFGK